MNTLLNSVEILLPVAQDWAEKQEARILAEGTPLNEAQLADAYKAGVVHPEKIRVLRVEVLPLVEHEEALFIAKHIGLYTEKSVGLTFNYGIYLRHDAWKNRSALVHECVHVSQYERLGGLNPFLKTYLRECIEPGYPFGRLEQEAIVISRSLCQPADCK